MRKTPLLLMALLLAAPVFGVKAPKHHHHPVQRHAKSQSFPKKRGKNPQFQQAKTREHIRKPAGSHPKNPNLPKHRAKKHSQKHES